MSRSFYQQLAEMTTIVADTGDIRLIEQLRPREATTNPSLITAAARMDEYRDVVDAALRRSRDEVGPGAEDVVRRAIDRLSVEFGTRILAVVEGRVSTEVDARLSFDRERTIEKARQLIAYYAQAGVPKERVLIKIASTWEGIEAARVLEEEGIHCNLTLLFGLHQAVACAEAGVTLISPFVGRILDWHRRRTGQAEFPGPDDPGVQSVTRIYHYYKRFGHRTQVMAASFRNLDEIIELAGCDLLTIAPALLQALREREGELGRRLDPASAAAEPVERLAMDEETFRRMHEEDDMARELLGEGIEGFCKAIVALEGLLAARLAELDGPDQAQRRESTVMVEETKAQETKAQLGMVGLAVMGRNLALNMIDHGYRVAGYNRNPELTDSAVAESGGRLIATRSLQELVATLERPRRVMLMIKAGEAVDQVMEELRPLLEPGDILIDGGNSWYEDTRRRERRYAEAGLRFFGVGVSGGEEGARRGPSLMPGGDREAYQALLPIFESISAKTESGPCVTHVGPDGAGHFVKMVHNGIEYADMQLIAESYDVLSRVGGLGPEALGEVFARWNRGPLESFLIEITAKIFTVRDERGGGWLIDKVLDRAGQKGTGRWTALVGLELGVPIPGIAAALDARAFSAMKGDRLKASASLQGPAPAAFAGDVEQLVSAVHDSLYAAKVVVYAQGMALIDAASRKYGWSIDLKELARIWKGGCIIRARFLDAIMSAYERRGDLSNLLLDERFREDVHVRQGAWRDVVSLAQRCGIPVAGLGSGLAYYDSYRTAELPQRLTQAQRDAFGSHQYQRNDDPTEAHVHTDWLK